MNTIDRFCLWWLRRRKWTCAQNVVICLCNPDRNRQFKNIEARVSWIEWPIGEEPAQYEGGHEVGSRAAP